MYKIIHLFPAGNKFIVKERIVKIYSFIGNYMVKLDSWILQYTGQHYHENKHVE